jgi:glutathionylspermidine synthase
MALQAAIDHYHALLTDDLAADSQAQLDAQLARRGLFFGKRPLCTVLRPRFLTAAQYAFLQKRCAPLMRAFGKAFHAATTDPSFLAQFGLEAWEHELIAADPGFRDPSPVSRLDAFFVHDRGGLRFTEYNAETPAAAAYNDVLGEVFLGLPVMREFLKRYEVRPQPSRQNVMHALLDAWRQFSGGRSRPRIAILDWTDVPTWSEFVITSEYLRSQGLECIIADPAEADYRDDTLFVAGTPVDLIYKRVLISELIERGGMQHPVVRAVRDRRVCMVNPFRCKILHKKASLAVLSDERNADLFTGEEQQAIAAHIPWTRTVEERHTTRAGRNVDLIAHVLAEREQLVLKPNDEYGGTGIVLGWQVDATAWEQSIRRALETPHVVQERVEIPVEAYPSLAGGRLVIEDRILDTAPFIWYGSWMDGCLTRLSTESLVNVTAGGGSSLATFVVEPRA